MTCRLCKGEADQIGGCKGWGLGDRETVSCALKNKRSLCQSPGNRALPRQRHRGEDAEVGCIVECGRLAGESLSI